jgi:hypothetical protein
MPRMLGRSLWLSFLALSACAGGSSGSTGSTGKAQLVDDRPLVGAGARCQGAACRCREVDAQGQTVGGDPGDAPAAGMKRFELRTGKGPDEVQITVEGRGTLHKEAGNVDVACGYVDLPAGEHRVRLRVKAPTGQGSSPRLLIYERGDKTGSWYHTFAMACGTGAACNRPELEDRLAELIKPRGLFDACGSVKIKDLKYTSERDAEDRITPLDLSFDLKVYDFEPRFPHGGKCKGLAGE